MYGAIVWNRDIVSKHSHHRKRPPPHQCTPSVVYLQTPLSKCLSIILLFYHHLFEFFAEVAHPRQYRLVDTTAQVSHTALPQSVHANGLSSTGPSTSISTSMPFAFCCNVASQSSQPGAFANCCCVVCKVGGRTGGAGRLQNAWRVDFWVGGG